MKLPCRGRARYLTDTRGSQFCNREPAECSSRWGGIHTWESQSTGQAYFCRSVPCFPMAWCDTTWVQLQGFDKCLDKSSWCCTSDMTKYCLKCAALPDSRAAEKARVAARDVIEYLDSIDFNKYFENLQRPSARSGEAQRVFLEFSLNSIKAAQVIWNSWPGLAWPGFLLSHVSLRRGLGVLIAPCRVY